MDGELAYNWFASFPWKIKAFKWRNNFLDKYKWWILRSCFVFLHKRQINLAGLLNQVPMATFGKNKTRQKSWTIDGPNIDSTSIMPPALTQKQQLFHQCRQTTWLKSKLSSKQESGLGQTMTNEPSSTKYRMESKVPLESQGSLPSLVCHSSFFCASSDQNNKLVNMS